MFIKILSDFSKRYLFTLLIVVSFVIHGILFFFSPAANQLLSIRSLRNSLVREPEEYTITFELENKDDEKEPPVSGLQKEKSRLEKEEKKYETFTDTSKSKEDEEPSAETDRIGEKGSLAKGNNPDKTKPFNNKPYADGQSKAPLLGKGEQGFSIENQQQYQAHETAEQFIKKEEKSGENNVARKSAQSEGNSAIQSEQMNITEMQEEKAVRKEYKKAQSGERPNELNNPVQAENDVRKQQNQKLVAKAGARQERFPEDFLIREGIQVMEESEESKDNENASKPEEGNLSSATQEMKEMMRSESEEEAKDEVKDNRISPSGLTGIMQQNKTETPLESQEALAEKEQPKVSFNMNAKDEGSGNDPVLFEDTLSNAEIPGAPSFNVKQHKYAAYFKHIRQRISLYWFLGYGTRAEIKLETSKDKPIIIEFKVLPDGTIEKVNIVEDAGNFQLASRLVSSIKSASPLDPFPTDMKEPSIDVRFNFFFF
ncbi:MAG: hypothetical protein E3K37_06845 [Candidatus Kuenenia sp.]|nr:hypothetical protein [Candidatus Kuenenia hertensis]